MRPPISVLRYLLAADLVDPAARFTVHVPATDCPDDLVAVWHVADDCHPFAPPTRPRQVTAADTLAAIDRDVRPVRFCAAEHPGTYRVPLSGPDRAAIEWLLDVDTDIDDPSPSGAGALRAALAAPAAPTHPGLRRVVADTITRAATALRAAPDTDVFRYRLLRELVDGVRPILGGNWETHPMFRYAEGEELAAAASADPDLTGWLATWLATDTEDRGPLVADGLALLAGPQAWVRSENEATAVLGAATHADFDPVAGTWLLRAPAWLVVRYPDPDPDVAYLALDAGYTPAAVDAAVRITGGQPPHPDAIAAMQVACT